jgi:hypothetical protein
MKKRVVTAKDFQDDLFTHLGVLSGNIEGVKDRKLRGYLEDSICRVYDILDENKEFFK